MSADELTAFFRREFPLIAPAGFRVDAVDPTGAVVVLDAGPEHLRPGGTLSGPTLMAMVDSAMWAALVGRLGMRAVLAYTSNLDIHFLSRPGGLRIVVTARLLRVGGRQAVGVVDVVDGDGAAVAHATVTYGLPA
ncbi:MAG: PaaI family thioesterase [Myxococcota bacterium]